ncbi:MAG: aspartate dehydrogenase [Thermoproteota archaeon]|nr:aspartate dehydrogenase [Thermoproteota archaeon]
MAIESRTIANASLVGVFDAIGNNAEILKSKLKSNPKVYSNFDSLIDSSIDIIVEAASQEAVRKFGMPIIKANKDLMIMSVGALADTTFLRELLELAPMKEGRSKVYVPTGAIAGIDAIRSVKDLLDSITLTTTKSPKSLAGAPFFATRKLNIDAITEVTEIYNGSAAEAVKLFPSNVNVAAVLSLAGLGADKTKVRVVVDPHTTTNQHEIVATGRFGSIKIAVNNVTAPGNPKTSFLAVLSAIECLRSICDDALKIGS